MTKGSTLLIAGTLFRRELLQVIRRHQLHSWLPIGLLLIALIWTGLTVILPLYARTQQPDDLRVRIPALLTNYAATMDGQALFGWVTNSELPAATVINPITLGALVFLVASSAMRLIKARAKPTPLSLGERITASYVVLFVGVFVQIAATYAAGGPHHFMLLYPFHHIISIAGLVLAAQALPKFSQLGFLTRRAVEAAEPPALSGQGFVLILILILLGSEVSVALAYDRAFSKENEFAAVWSPVLYELVAYLDSRDVDAIYYGDWGIHTPVIALGNNRTRQNCTEVWGALRDMDDPNQGQLIFDRLFQGKQTFVLFFAERSQVMPNVRNHFMAFIRHFGAEPLLERTLSSPGGTQIYEVFCVDARRGNLENARMCLVQ